MNQIKSQVKTTNINYKYINGANVTINGVNYNNNDNGVFLFNGTDDNGGSNPIYYYRGNVTNNNVLFANLCWKIVRTTSTGGIKLIYNGVPTDGTCNNTETASQYGTSSYNDWDELFDQAGYMYGENNDEYFGSNKVDKWFTYSNNVTYDSSTNAYTLHVPLDSWKWSTERTEIANYGYHYTCFDSNPCTILHYVMFFKNASWIYYLDLTGGDTLETLKDSYFSNTVDSAIKTKVDSFYETYLTNYASHLENTIFCNDRNFETGPLSSEYATGMGDSFFGGIQRLNIKYSPSLKCTRQNDKFSLSTSNGGTSGYGNNALKYPIALLTSDEVQMAGGKYATSNINYYLYNNESYWLMTPNGWHGSSYPTLTMLYVGKGAVYDYSPTYAFGVRPVISLKSGIQFSGGNGTVNMPYIISE